VQAVKAHRGKGDIATLILSLETILEWSGSHLFRFTPYKKGFRYAFNRRLPATHIRDACFVKEKKYLALVGNRIAIPQFPSLQPRYYIDYATAVCRILKNTAEDKFPQS